MTHRVQLLELRRNDFDKFCSGTHDAVVEAKHGDRRVTERELQAEAVNERRERHFEV